MDKILFKLIESTWGRNILYTLFAVLIGAIFLLGRETARLNEVRAAEQAAWRNEVREIWRQHAQEKDAMRREQMEIIQAALDAQRKINERINSLKRNR
jgi:hypothetical protein